MKPNPKMLIVAVIFVALVVGYYAYLSSRNTSSAENLSGLTEVQKITTENLDRNYPETPREVIRFYNRILQCYYNEEYTEEELSEVADQALKLFDAELLAKNPKDQYLAGVKNDVAAYRRDGKTISNITISDSKDVSYETVNGRDCAYVSCVYYIREGSSWGTANQTYVLRKDDEGKWRILGFYRNRTNPDGTVSYVQD